MRRDSGLGKLIRRNSVINSASTGMLAMSPNGISDNTHAPPAQDANAEDVGTSNKLSSILDRSDVSSGSNNSNGPSKNTRHEHTSSKPLGSSAHVNDVNTSKSIKKKGAWLEWMEESAKQKEEVDRLKMEKMNEIYQQKECAKRLAKQKAIEEQERKSHIY